MTTPKNSPADETDQPPLWFRVIFFVLIGYLLLLFSYVALPFIPMTLIHNPLMAIHAIRAEMQLNNDHYPEIYWNEVDHDKQGLTLRNAEKSYEGYTLYTSTDKLAAVLVDENGEKVHEWALPFEKAWPNPPHIEKTVPEFRRRWRNLHLYPNGDLLAIYYGVGATPWGYGLVKIDKESNLIWTYDAKAHHDVNVMPDGRIVTLTHEMSIAPIDGMDHIVDPYFDDFVVLLDPNGKVIKEISILKAMSKSFLRDMMHSLPYDPTHGVLGAGDILHANAADPIPAGLESVQPMLKEGHILVSLRNISMMVIIDPETERVTWAAYGSWRNQHDGDILPDGTIMLFDNDGDLNHGGSSRVIRFNPMTQEIVWEYTGDEDHPLDSPFMSEQQLLPNGNLLITASNQGRLVEITRDGEVVWEYYIPFRAESEDRGTVIPTVFGGERFEKDSLSFLDTLTEK